MGNISEPSSGGIVWSDRAAACALVATVVANGVIYDLGGAEMIKRLVDPPPGLTFMVSVGNPYILPDQITTLSTGYVAVAESLVARTAST